MRSVALILAAGEGTRMKSALPKVLHPLLGAPMLHHVVRCALEAGVDQAVVVVGHGAERVEASLAAAFGPRVTTALQPVRRGTGDAAARGLEAAGAGSGTAVVLYGDTPLLLTEDVAALLAAGRDAPLAMLTTRLAEPRGYGRILRDAGGAVVGVREEKDCSPEERAITEVNPGVYAFDLDFLREALPALKPNNQQGEYYLTDTVALAAARGRIASREADQSALLGVNDRTQLAEAERILLARLCERWRKAGVTIRDGVRLDATVELEPDVTLEAGAVLRGATRVGAGAHVDVGCVLTDAEIGPGALLKPYSVVTQSKVGKGAQIGPFAHLRPGSAIGEEAHVGNFVETKNTTLGRGAKANHLAYLGDGDVGEGANVGAGTIFCNYDGFRKHRTTIGAGAFIGSDSQLVAPVTVGEGAYVGTGTTVTEDVPADALAIGRARQQNKAGYASRLRARLKGGTLGRRRGGRAAAQATSSTGSE
jgi:bifunctional UDP-N-acetylglucosamine pyrophosphorylase/glucosamine-1-phosphate N-acetyltransferase